MGFECKRSSYEEVTIYPSLAVSRSQSKRILPDSVGRRRHVMVVGARIVGRLLHLSGKPGFEGALVGESQLHGPNMCGQRGQSSAKLTSHPNFY
jgi:hypothetical protein